MADDIIMHILYMSTALLYGGIGYERVASPCGTFVSWYWADGRRLVPSEISVGLEKKFQSDLRVSIKKTGSELDRA